MGAEQLGVGVDDIVHEGASRGRGKRRVGVGLGCRVGMAELERRVHEIAGDERVSVAVGDADNAVAYLVQAPRGFRLRAVGEEVAVHVFDAAPLPVEVTVETEVQSRTEVEAGVGHHLGHLLRG